ncbi:MAG: Trk system potassium transporter TrkA [Proteobacteria bacterium]|nr:Trk system potassium transporter TrkA [Pseudomonadota bacterium]
MKIIIMGAGEVGYNLAMKLSKENHDVVVIDHDPEKIRHIDETLDVKSLLGKGSSPGVLKQAGIEEAEMVIAVTDSDEINMVACLIAGTQSKIPKRIARIRNLEYTRETQIFDEQHLDIDLCINPEMETAETVVRLIEHPGSADFAEFADGRVELIGVKIEQDSYVVGKKLRELREVRELFPDLKVLIVAISRNDRIVIPHGDETIFVGDILYAVVDQHSIRKVLAYLRKQEDPVKKVFIAGGSHIAFEVARQLQEKGIAVRIIEKDSGRCQRMAESLERALILQGEITDQRLLREEGVDDADFFVSASDDEDANILASLLAKRLGARKTITLVRHLHYLSVLPAIGIDAVVSPRLSAIGRIMHYIRKGKILSVTTLKEEDAEVIETVALDTSDIVNRPIKDLKFPKGALIGAVVRGEEVIIPGGNDIILPDDRVVIFALQSAIPKVEKTLMVKVEYF